MVSCLLMHPTQKKKKVKKERPCFILEPIYKPKRNWLDHLTHVNLHFGMKNK